VAACEVHIRWCTKKCIRYPSTLDGKKINFAIGKYQNNVLTILSKYIHWRQLMDNDMNGTMMRYYIYMMHKHFVLREII